MTALRAARDFGIDPALAATISLRFNPAGGTCPGRHDQLVEALSSALVDGGAVTFPDRA